ncbi:SWIM zinc finger family protein [Spirillospora sp. CA-255316]
MPPFTKEDVRELAGAKSYERGIGYLDAVEDLEADDAGVYAAVQGTEVYSVRLRLGRGLDGECDCPWGEEGNFCKHCVAVALVYLYDLEHGVEIARRFDLRERLAGMGRDRLEELLLEVAERHRGARRYLEELLC